MKAYNETHLIETKAGAVVVTTGYTDETGWQTVVMKATKTGTVIDWNSPLETRSYSNIEEAKVGQSQTVSEWSQT